MKLPELLDFFRAQVDACHAALDSVKVPRLDPFEGRLSLSERMEYLAHAYKAMQATTVAIANARRP